MRACVRARACTSMRTRGRVGAWAWCAWCAHHGKAFPALPCLNSLLPKGFRARARGEQRRLPSGAGRACYPVIWWDVTFDGHVPVTGQAMPPYSLAVL